jgi:hypothetical protein
MILSKIWFSATATRDDDQGLARGLPRGERDDAGQEGRRYRADVGDGIEQPGHHAEQQRVTLQSALEEKPEAEEEQEGNDAVGGRDDRHATHVTAEDIAHLCPMRVTSPGRGPAAGRGSGPGADPYPSGRRT